MLVLYIGWSPSMFANLMKIYMTLSSQLEYFCFRVRQATNISHNRLIRKFRSLD